MYGSQQLSYNPRIIPFRDLFARYLPRGGTCFEVGCYPGMFLAYLGLEHEFTVSGIDATPQVTDRLVRHLEKLGVRVGTLHHGNVFTFVSPERYDVVCSFGFIEHFAHVDNVIGRHVALLKPGGTLVLTCPNFRGLQYVLHRLLDSENLARHPSE